MEIKYQTIIVGAGYISRPHAKALKTLGIGIAGVLDSNVDRAKELAEQYGSKVIQNLDEVLADVDMVHIFTPPAYRLEYVRKAAAAGKHLFVEKPIAISVADAQEIVMLAAKNQVKLVIDFNHRFRTGYRMLQDAVQDGRLGEIIGVFDHRLGAGRGFGGTPLGSGWWNDPKQVCGISIESLAHEIDMLLHLVDGVTSVSANTFSTISGSLAFDNNAAVTFQLKNGGVGTIQASWSSYLHYSSRGVIGTKGTAMITGDDQFDFTNFIIKTADMPYRQIINVDDRFAWPVPNEQCYQDINCDFIESIEQDRKPKSSGEDGLRALLFSQAILKSSQTGQAVAVDL
jgi:predicted dehydrogenase